jgi:hypothetical protein
MDLRPFLGKHPQFPFLATDGYAQLNPRTGRKARTILGLQNDDLVCVFEIAIISFKTVYCSLYTDICNAERPDAQV